jgi:hypothetical protein
MGKVLLFHNNAKSLPPRTYKFRLNQSTEAVIRETVITNPYGNRNTGTYLMTDTLKKIVDADELIPRFYEFTEHVDTVVTNILHRIGANLKVDIPYWENILSHCDRVIPLSLGFAFNDGEVAPLDRSLLDLLTRFAERAELGVRSEYDAEILNAYHIKNVRVIGCPSLHYHMDRDFKVNDSVREVKSVNFNFTTDFANLGISQKDAVDIHWPLLLTFIRRHEKNLFNIDFTMQKPPFAEICDIHSILLSYGEVHQFYSDCGRYFYSVRDWIDGIKEKNDFSIGTRFHGNIAAILAGVPTLMINVDKRMKGMNDYYKIPSIDIGEFDYRKPIEYYRELADYSEFNRNYSEIYDDFVDYCNKNGVTLNHSIGEKKSHEHTKR